MNPTTTPVVPQEVLTYIRHELGRGVAELAIRQQFTAQGWSPAVVDMAFGQALSPLQPSQVQGAMVGAVTGIAPAGKPPAALALPAPLQKVLHRVLSDVWLTGIFKGGFAFIFLINGLIAWVHPADFIRLLSSFPIATMLGHIPQMIMFTGLHDIVLGLLILSGKWQKYVLAWAGVWLSLVTLIKLVSLI